MSAGVHYLVEVELRQTGDLGAGLGKFDSAVSSLSGKADKLGADFGNAASFINDGFIKATESLLNLGKKAAIGAGAGLLGGAIYGVFDRNKGLETTQMSLASIFQAGGQTKDLTDGMLLAGDIMAKMRTDASKLPGEFSDLLSIVRSIGTPGSNMGMNVYAIEEMAAKAMASGTAMGFKSPMIGRELAMAMQGRVGAHNPFATNLGISGAEATKFKALDDKGKIDYLTKALDKYKGANDLFGGSLDANMATLVDHGKEWISLATKPVFELAKAELNDINAWFDSHGNLVKGWAERGGRALVDGFNKGKAIILEYGPLLIDFADTAYSKLLGIWTDIEPYVEKFGKLLKDALSDPDGTIGKLKEVLELYAVAKGGSILGGSDGPLGKGLGGMATGGVAGYLGGGALDKATGLNGIFDKIDAGAGAGGSLGNTIGGLKGGVVGAMIGAVGGEFKVLYDDLSTINPQFRANAEALLTMRQGLYDSQGRIDTSSKAYQEATSELEKQMHGLGGAVELLHGGFTEILYELVGGGGIKGIMAAGARSMELHDAAATMQGHKNEMLEELRENAAHERKVKEYKDALAANERERTNREAMKNKQDKLAGAGVFNQYVTLTISSNQAPGQIARRAVDFIMQEARNPKASRSVPNYSAVNHR